LALLDSPLLLARVHLKNAKARGGSNRGRQRSIKNKKMGDEDDDNRPLFVGNLDPYLRARELTELFEKKGKVKKLGM
jgi:RNA recognition motif-containing protein